MDPPAGWRSLLEMNDWYGLCRSGMGSWNGVTRAWINASTVAIQPFKVNGRC